MIGQSYEAKIRVVNDIFALRDNNVLEPTQKTRRKLGFLPRQHSFDDTRDSPTSISVGSSGIPLSRTTSLTASLTNEHDNYDDVYNLTDLFAESDADRVRYRLGSEGRMVQLRYSEQDSSEIDTSKTVGSFQVVSLYTKNQFGTGRSSLVSKQKLEQAVTSKDDCCRVSFSHPLLSEATVIVSPSIPHVFNSDDIIHALKNDYIPFFIYAVEEIPLSEEDLNEF